MYSSLLLQLQDFPLDLGDKAWYELWLSTLVMQEILLENALSFNVR